MDDTRLIDARELLDEAGRKRVDEAVQAAEQATSGEIVPVLASRSDRYDRAPFMAALAAAALATLVVVVGVGLYQVGTLASWELAELSWDAPLYVLLPAQVVGLALGFRLAQGNPLFARGFVPRALMQLCVDRAARQAFQAFHLAHTKDATGILIYVSLYERMVVVLADKAIDAKHGQDTWNGVRDKLLAGLRDGRPADGFADAIAECGRVLSVDFPRAEDDTDELQNHLRIIHA